MDNKLAFLFWLMGVASQAVEGVDSDTLSLGV